MGGLQLFSKTMAVDPRGGHSGHGHQNSFLESQGLLPDTAEQPMRLLDWQFLGETSHYPPIKFSPNLLNLILLLVSNIKYPRKQLAFTLVCGLQ